LKVGDVAGTMNKIDFINSRFWPVEQVYTLDKDNTVTDSVIATIDDLERLGEFHDTDWAILGGGDRADPMKEQLGARTIFSLLAKGLPGSRSNPYKSMGEATKYIYYLLGLWSLTKHTLEEIKAILKEANDSFDSLDFLTVERWGMWDLMPWCEENNIKFEPVYPSYDKQKAAFTELFLAVRDGRFKAPPIPIMGSRDMNILQEELLVFDHDPDKKWFGSPEKKDKRGIQDDSVYSIAWAMYGGRELGVETFRPRRKAMGFGDMFVNRELSGRW